MTTPIEKLRELSAKWRKGSDRHREDSKDKDWARSVAWRDLGLANALATCADELDAALSDLAANEQKEAIEFKPQAGEPPEWFSEWFIANLDNGDRVVLRRLPPEYTYDYTTADHTFYMARRLKWWMQFPDSDFVPLEQKEAGGQDANPAVSVAPAFKGLDADAERCSPTSVMSEVADKLRRADTLACKCPKLDRRKVIGRIADENLSVILEALAQPRTEQAADKAVQIGYIDPRIITLLAGHTHPTTYSNCIKTEGAQDEKDVPLYAYAAPEQPAAERPEEAGFKEWVVEQMPAGTVIGNPEWWADRLARAYEMNVPTPPLADVVVDEVIPPCKGHSWRDYGTVNRVWCPRCNSVAVAGYEDRPYAALSIGPRSNSDG